MRFSSASLASALLSSALLAGCLPSYNGKNPNDAGKAEDLAEAPVADLSGVDFTTPPVIIDAGSTGTLSITLDKPTSSLRLNETMVINVTITANSQTGSAALSLAKAPPGLTATFNPASVTLGPSPVTSVMTVTAASDMTVVSNATTMVTATVGTDASTAPYGVSIIPKLVVHLAAGMGGVMTTTSVTSGHTASGFPKMLPTKLLGQCTTTESTPRTLPACLPVDFYNDDTVNHEIHADSTSLGMLHEGGVLMPKGAAMYETYITATGTAKFYCHLHGGTADSTGAKPAPADEGTIVVTQ